MNKKLIRKYAQVIAIKGINLKKGQPVCIYAPTSAAEFVEILTEELYQNNASQVLVEWSNATINKLKFKYQSAQSFKEVPTYIKNKAKYFYQHQMARISISSIDPNGMKGIDFNKLKIHSKAMACLDPYLSDPYMASRLQWCVIAIPNPLWAKKVFPNLSVKKAVDALWDAIFKANYILKDNDPILAWKKHDETLHDKARILNEYNFKSLIYKASNGTDFEIGLVKNHIWAGGSEGDGQEVNEFNPNMPTEEIFTMPHKDFVNGKVVASKPLVYHGNLIEDFYFIFKDGKVVEAKAKVGQEVLDALIHTDEGSCRLGEVALVNYHSPISLSNILFYNTLFDENASCHLALGNAYTMNIKDGTIVKEEELIPLGYNRSLVHVDFMIGTKDLHIVGVTQDNQKVDVFLNGDFII